MQRLEALISEARGLAGGEPGSVRRSVSADRSLNPPGPGVPRRPAGDEAAAEAEVARILQICNACRYCEGFCAVFPAMTRRLEFAKADVHYLANLCHSCGACLHACQYAPPHEFAVNVPKSMAEVRGRTYVDYAWPQVLGVLYTRNGLTLSVALSAGLAIFVALALMASAPFRLASLPGAFYAVFPHELMAWSFGAVFAFDVLALGIGVRRFVRDVSSGPVTSVAAVEATRNTLALTYLGGGHGEGCNDEDDAFSLRRRWFHHLTFYGFMLCFAATVVATLYHYLLHLEAPYPLLSLPVLLGSLGGIGLVTGPVGLLWLNIRRDPMHRDDPQNAMDRGFIMLLLLVSVSGLILLALRGTGAMAILLAFHLGTVMALFITLPYGKFAHGVFRSAALLKWSIERRLPTGLRLGDN
jgi:citrate/tricarballylate utilization protein